jgi:hypothetical protein
MAGPGGPGRSPFPAGFLPPLKDEQERKRHEEVNEKFGTPEKCNLTCTVGKGMKTFDIDFYDE